MITPFDFIERLRAWFFAKDRDITLQEGRTIVVTAPGVSVTINSSGVVVTGGDVTIDGSSVSVSGHSHTIAHASTTGQTADDHHPQSHTVASHSDTSATGSELNTLTDGSNADALHDHSVASHTIASHSDTSATGSELNTLTNGSDASSLHDHDGRYFQESEFSSDPGATSKPLETSSSGNLRLQDLYTDADVLVGSGLTVGSSLQAAPSSTIYLDEVGSPGTPPSGYIVMWANTTGRMYYKNDGGTQYGPL